MWSYLLLVAVGATGDAVVREVTCAEVAFSQSAERRDLAAFAAHVAPAAVFAGGGAPLRGREAIAAAWSESFFQPDSARITWRPGIVEADAGGTLVMSTGPYRIDTADGSQWGRFSSIWQQQPDGGWQVIFDNGMPGAGPIPEPLATVLAQPFDCPG